MKEPKQVIVMRKDKNMRKGKMVAQGGHASMKVFFDKNIIGGWLLWLVQKILGKKALIIPLNDEEYEWAVLGRFKKICLGVDSEEELIDIYNDARDLGLPVAMIIDSGLTEFNGVPTKTCLAIGPADPDKIDTVTGHLKPL